MIKTSEKIQIISNRIKQNPTRFQEVSIKLTDHLMNYLKLDNSVKNINDERVIYILLMMYSLIVKDYSLFPKLVKNHKNLDDILMSIDRFLSARDVKRLTHNLRLENNEQIFEHFLAFYSEIKPKIKKEIITTSILLLDTPLLNKSFVYAVNNVFEELGVA